MAKQLRAVKADSKPAARPVHPAGSRDELIQKLSTAADAHGAMLPDGAIVFQLDVTAELAKALLHHTNTNNIRAVHHAWVRQYAQDMKSGHWGPNYDPIILTPEWVLNNGQHRLRAIELSGVTLALLFVIAARPEARRGMDCGAKRNITATHDVDQRHAAVGRMMLLLGSPHSARHTTRSDLAEFVGTVRDTISDYAALFAKRPILSEAHIVAAFCFAAVGRPDYASTLFLIAEDIAAGGQEFPSSKAIATHVLQRKQAQVRLGAENDRIIEANRILRVLQVEMCGGTVGSLAGDGWRGAAAWWKDVGAK